MVDRIKDSEELRLEALFRSDPLPDNDFSAKVMARVRRQIWIRRLTMPIALVLGGLIALKPATEVVSSMFKVINVLPASLTNISLDLPSMPLDSVTQVTPYLIGGAMLFLAVFLYQALEE
jgi:hypothetical protein